MPGVLEDFVVVTPFESLTCVKTRFNDLGLGLPLDLDLVRGLRRGPALTSGTYIWREDVSESTKNYFFFFHQRHTDDFLFTGGTLSRL